MQNAQTDTRHRAEDARQGDIVMHDTWQRAVFLSGLLGFVFLVMVGIVVGIA